jgi:hypothetical protein
LNASLNIKSASPKLLTTTNEAEASAKTNHFGLVMDSKEDTPVIAAEATSCDAIVIPWPLVASRASDV